MAGKAKMFSGSFLDDPQSYAYFKVARETRQNHVDLHEMQRSQLTDELLPHVMRNDRYFSGKLGIKLNKNLKGGAIAKCISAHASTKL